MDHGDHGGGGTNSTDGGMMHMMSMSFHFGMSETVLFEFWKISEVGGMIGSFLFIFCLAVAYEALKFYRDHLYQEKAQQMTSEQIPFREQGNTSRQINVKIISIFHFNQTFLHVIQMVVSYFLMLIFMTYNVWLCLAVALGAGMGYFLFGWKKTMVIDVTEHCH